MIRVSYEFPPPQPPPPVTFIVRSTEGHGTWRLTETEARQLHAALGEQIAEADARRARDGLLGKLIGDSKDGVL